MNIEDTIRVLSNERACVMRNTAGACDRNCAACDLVLPDELVISAYLEAVNILRAHMRDDSIGADETILFFEKKKQRGHPCDSAKYDMAISALKAKQEAEKNEPLTLDELRYMDGEPVYMVYDGEGGPLEGWVLVDVDSEDEWIWLTNSPGGRSEYSFDEGLEDGMMLYRRPPEGGAV